MYDAWSIEKAIENLCRNSDGKRGKFYDVDVFRCGRPDDLAQFLEGLSQAIKAGVSPVLQTDKDREWLDLTAKRIWKPSR